MLADINGNLADLRSEAMGSQRFCLRWNNHQSNLLSVFDQLLHDEAFVDVTLAVEGQLLRAHKMVLSACSPYFQALFVGHPDKHPIVILKDVPYVDMRSLLDFMYRGEVSVDQERLTAFLRVAESLRIKGLTEVNEDKCELPNITSSLMSNQSQAPQQPPPSLHRINQISHQSLPQKRFHHVSSHPLLGSALTAPKRKRGRPRKLSGSSDTPLDSISGDHQLLSSDLVQGSPEMMEMKMGLDFQSELNSSSATAAANLAERTKKDEPMENGTDEGGRGVKREPEPTPSTSAQATEESFTRPLSRQGSESFKQDSAFKSEDSWKEKSSRGRNSRNSESPTCSTPSTTSTTNTSTPSSRSTFSSPVSSRANAQNNNNNSSSTNNNNNNTSNNNNNSSSENNSGANQQEASMSAPTRQVPKRRMRRRATSQSTDPAEQLTEMSVRGLNLFRYASISEGVYQCTECAKLDIVKTFKNKYSFQRHAFLYHEGHQRKVFPCPVCQKQFSRPDKMKNHMKTVHDCFMQSSDCVMPFSFFIPP